MPRDYQFYLWGTVGGTVLGAYLFWLYIEIFRDGKNRQWKMKLISQIFTGLSYVRAKTGSLITSKKTKKSSGAQKH